MAPELNTRGFKIAITAYDTALRFVIPALRLNSRLKDGYRHRRLIFPLPPADLWIQAASAGEAYLATSLLDSLQANKPLRVLVTTNTRQGMEILEKAAQKTGAGQAGMNLVPAWFPFDRPGIMEKAVYQVRPKLVVLMETEIWPGFLYALKKARCPVWILNGRMTEKSFSGYMRVQHLLYPMRPTGVFAISQTDADRFAKIFGRQIVGKMPNMKFDRLHTEKNPDPVNSLSALLPSPGRFLVLGSIRQQEEGQILKLIQNVRAHHPDLIIGLFPRHMHRLDYWKAALCRNNARFTLRSALQGPARPGHILLWDTFGELSKAYTAADAVFVGGSLAPLGGQNFLEPMACGVRPVIGPYWENFFWVENAVFQEGLVYKANNWQDAAGRLLQDLRSRPDREQIQHAAWQYIRARQGGTRLACQVIKPYLTEAGPKEPL